MADPLLPGQHGSVTDKDGRATIPWYSWFRFLDTRVKSALTIANAASTAVAAIPAAASPTVIHPSADIEPLGNTSVGYTLNLSAAAKANNSQTGPRGRKGEDGEPGRRIVIQSGGSSGSGSTPTGTGLVGVTSGVQDAAAVTIGSGLSLAAGVLSATGGSSSGDNYTDATFSNVKALLHFNGTHGSTTFTDVIGTTWTATAATISTAQSVFGGASGSFPASGNSRIDAPTNSGFDVAAGDWTIQMRVYPNGTHQAYARLFQTRMGDTYPAIDISEQSGTGSNLFGLRLSSNGTSFDVLNAPTANFTLVASQWNDLLIQRRNGSIQIVLNRAQVIATAISATASLYYNSGNTVTIGGQTGVSRGFNGYIDEFRFTKGQALYSAYALPTSAFADS